MDYEQVMNDKKLREQLEGGETIVLTMKVIKFTGQNKKLPRVIAITNKNVYNISPAEGSAVKSFFQSLVNKSRIKRKIPLSAITSITISKIVKEFILKFLNKICFQMQYMKCKNLYKGYQQPINFEIKLSGRLFIKQQKNCEDILSGIFFYASIIHIPTEYDQRYQVDDQLSLIIQTLCEVYVKHNLKKIRCHFIEEMNLSPYTTTNYDIKKNIRRQLPKQGTEMTVDDVKIAMQAARGNVQTIYQKSNTQEISIEDFTLIKMLGRGAFGKVMLCEKKDTKEIFAIKSLRKEDIISRDHIEYLKTERKILEQTQHPFLVSLEYAFITQECVYFVMKFMIGGELYTHLQKVSKFNEDYALFYSSQVLLALEYLHKQGIIYRDLKPENILMDEKGYVALTDYGLAKFLSKGQVAQSIVGTPEYLAPEVITQQGHAFTADWWCLGILIFEMLCGRTPFFSENRNQMFRNIVEFELKFPSTINLSFDCKNLLTALLKKKPNERLGNKGDAEEIKKHPWFKKMDFQKLLQKEIQAPIIPDLQSATDLSNFNPQILDEKIEEDQNQTTNKQALKKFDQEFYGLNYKKE